MFLSHYTFKMTSRTVTWEHDLKWIHARNSARLWKDWFFWTTSVILAGSFQILYVHYGTEVLCMWNTKYESWPRKGKKLGKFLKELKFLLKDEASTNVPDNLVLLVLMFKVPQTSCNTEVAGRTRGNCFKDGEGTQRRCSSRADHSRHHTGLCVHATF